MSFSWQVRKSTLTSGEAVHFAEQCLRSDCVYLEAAFLPLVETMVEMSTPNTEILVSSAEKLVVSYRASKNTDTSNDKQTHRTNFKSSAISNEER